MIEFLKSTGSKHTRWLHTAAGGVRDYSTCSVDGQVKFLTVSSVVKFAVLPAYYQC